LWLLIVIFGSTHSGSESKVLDSIYFSPRASVVHYCTLELWAMLGARAKSRFMRSEGCIPIVGLLTAKTRPSHGMTLSDVMKQKAGTNGLHPYSVLSNVEKAGSVCANC